MPAPLSPYRDENASLRAENARLRSELARARSGGLGSRGVLVAALVALDFAAIVALRPWLNGSSDLRFWGALLIVFALAALAVVRSIAGGR